MNSELNKKELSQLKNLYKEKFQNHCHKFLDNHNSQIYLKKQTLLVDRLLIKLWQNLLISKKIALIAVGGYGRQELFPYSDVDILIVYKKEISKGDQELISKFITNCWDLGFKIGHSVRNIEQTKQEFKADITTATNLIESRFLEGSKKIFEEMKRVIKISLSIKNFYRLKLEEQAKRHRKYKDSAYQLEPNIKESPGGLRDLHMVRWLSISQGKGATFKQMYESNLIDDIEFNRVQLHENKITKRRILLHILAQRIEDRLVFDVQNKLASNLGFVSKKNNKSSEIVMKSYYKSVNYITLFNEILIKRLDPNTQKKIVLKHKLPFYIYNNLIELDKKNTSKIEPYIFDAFLLFQKYKQTKGFGPNLLRALDSFSLNINKNFRLNASHQEKFLSIFKSKNKVSRSLRLLNKCNILGKYIPAFGKIVAQMQHDLFHIYTVDEHTLNVIENIRRFTLDKWKHEFPECNTIFRSFKKPFLLYFAALFHDIAKGRGGDHSKLGETIALRFGRIMKLDNEDTNLIAWLVKSHLKMSSVAQKSDLADSFIIDDFAKFVQTQYRLDALYLLTVADIRGTSPHVWNQWKASLLRSLYLETKNNLMGKELDIPTIIKERKDIAKKVLSRYSIKPKSYHKLWVNFNEDYFLRFEGKDVAWHTRVLMPHFQEKNPIVRVRHGADGQGIEVLIFTKDADALFAKITNFFYDMKCEIVQATITTTKHNYALDVFNLIDIPNESVSYKHYFQHIETELSQYLLNKNSNLTITLPKKTPQATYHKIESRINYKKIKNNRYQLDVICASRPNLLGLIIKEISLLGMSIHNAKINTLGQRAEDFFIVSSKNKSNLENQFKKLLKNIKSKIND